MFDGQRIAVVVPCFKEETQIEKVVATMPAFVDRIIVIDDRSPDGTVEVVKGLLDKYENLELLIHPVNRGVGAAIVTGYKRALDEGMDVVAVMAGDGQMPPDELADIVRPVTAGKADYSKANRLVADASWDSIPRKRFLGNAALSFLTKIASGYYQVADSQTGFTAISASMLKRLDLDAMYPRYGYPNDMLVRLNVERARVVDVASVPVYDVGEQSKLKIRRVLFTLSWLLTKRFWWRMWRLYVVRDFHPLVLFGALGAFLLTTGVLSGVALTVLHFTGETVTGATAAVVSLFVQSGLLMSMFAMLFDFEHNRYLVADERPVGSGLPTALHTPIDSEIHSSSLPSPRTRDAKRETELA